MKEVSDINFLRGILVSIIEDGWTTGTLCSRNGAKCVLGAGMQSLGFAFIKDGNWVPDDYNQWKSLAEDEASLRLLKLLPIPRYHTRSYVIDSVTRWNDQGSREAVVDTINRKLVELELAEQRNSK